MTPGPVVKLASCAEICTSRLTTSVDVSGCKVPYDSTTKAVRTAENRPAYNSFSILVIS